jgi:hypothetical protein
VSTSSRIWRGREGNHCDNGKHVAFGLDEVGDGLRRPPEPLGATRKGPRTRSPIDPCGPLETSSRTSLALRKSSATRFGLTFAGGQIDPSLSDNTPDHGCQPPGRTTLWCGVRTSSPTLRDFEIDSVAMADLADQHVQRGSLSEPLGIGDHRMDPGLSAISWRGPPCVLPCRRLLGMLFGRGAEPGLAS